MTQEDRILDYLDKHPTGITQFEAIQELGILRLASRISDLKKDGHKITSERIKVRNRYGEECYVSKYYFAKEN